MGWPGDRCRRTWLLGLGVGRLEPGDRRHRPGPELRAPGARASLLGIGEATYGVIAPTILMDLFPRERRARVLLGVLPGHAARQRAGDGPGGDAIATRAGGWHMAFFLVGVPGLLAAFAALLLPEPIRGASEGVDPERLRAHERAGASREDYIDLMVNSSYTYSVFGMAAYTFAIGGMLVWVPDVPDNTRGMRAGSRQPAPGPGDARRGDPRHDASAAGWPTAWPRRTPAPCSWCRAWPCSASIPFVLLALFAGRAPLIFRRHLPGRGADVRQHRPVQRDHRQRGDAEHAGGGLRGRRSSRSTSWATSGRPR